MPDHAKNGLSKSTVGGSSPETLSAGIKRTAGSHPKEDISGELPRALVHILKIKCSLAETVCQALGLACGIRCSGMAPCGPFYSLQRVCRRQGLGRSRAFRIGEPMRYAPYRACKIKSELLQLIQEDL
jgi:hypothetical protein